MRTLHCVFALMLALAVGCGGTDPSMMGSDDLPPGAVGDGGLLTFGVECSDNAQCESGLCTKAPYDRKPNPVCTYMCDPTMPEPKCPFGCNMKHYCKIP